FFFSSIGREKNSCALRLRFQITSGGTPWPVIVKNPISVQMRSICRPVRRRATGSPANALVRSTTGISIWPVSPPCCKGDGRLDGNGRARQRCTPRKMIRPLRYNAEQIGAVCWARQDYPEGPRQRNIYGSGVQEARAPSGYPAAGSSDLSPALQCTLK